MQAFVITAYQSPSYLTDLINRITTDGDHAYVHIDTKSSITPEELKLTNPDRVHLYQKYSINWGSYNHLAALIFLLQQLPDNIEYVHIISGQDMPIRSPRQFVDKFNNCKQSFMTVTPLSRTDTSVRRRLEGYNLFPNADSRKPIFRAVNKAVWAIRHILHIDNHKIGEFTDIYKGMIWASLPYEQIEYVLEYIRSHQGFIKKLKHTLLPEEFFLQTILMNSKFRDAIVTNNLHYTVWEKKHGSLPALLDEEDYGDIMKSECFFARKIALPYSKTLIAKIDSVLRENA